MTFQFGALNINLAGFLLDGLVCGDLLILNVFVVALVLSQHKATSQQFAIMKVFN